MFIRADLQGRLGAPFAQTGAVVPEDASRASIEMLHNENRRGYAMETKSALIPIVLQCRAKYFGMV